MEVEKYTDNHLHYSEDFETSSHLSMHLSQNDLEEDFSYSSNKTPQIPSAAGNYSDDFESEFTYHTSNPPSPTTRNNLSYTRYSQDSFDSLDSTQTFSEDSDSSRAIVSSSDHSRTFSSSEGTRLSVIRSPTRYGEDVQSVSNTFSSNTSVSCSETSSLSESDSDLKEEEQKMKDDFLSKKLQILRLNREGLTKPITDSKFKKTLKERRINQYEKKFFDRKLELLRNKSSTEQSTTKNLSKPCTAWESKKYRLAGDYGIKPFVVNSLKVQNTLEDMKKASKTKIHQPRKCKACRKNIEQVALRDFMKTKMAIASSKLIEEKLQNQIYLYTNPIGMLQSGMGELPKLSDDPKEIYQKLTQPLRQSELKTSSSKEGIHVPSSLQITSEYDKEFWEEYFKPLNDCTWFPHKSNEKLKTGEVSTDQNPTDPELNHSRKGTILTDSEDEKDSDFSRPSSCSLDDDLFEIKKLSVGGNNKIESSTESLSPVHNVFFLSDMVLDGPSNNSLTDQSSSGSDSSLESSSHKLRSNVYSVDLEENDISGLDSQSSDDGFGANVYSVGDLSV